jgi:hypothetical protein
MNPIVMLGLGVGAFMLWKQSQAPKGPTPSVPDNGPYFQNFANQINSYTQLYSNGTITLDQWTGYMQSIKSQVAQARSNGQVTDNDVATLNNATGI